MLGNMTVEVSYTTTTEHQNRVSVDCVEKKGLCVQVCLCPRILDEEQRDSHRTYSTNHAGSLCNHVPKRTEKLRRCGRRILPNQFIRFLLLLCRPKGVRQPTPHGHMMRSESNSSSNAAKKERRNERHQSVHGPLIDFVDVLLSKIATVKITSGTKRSI